jgi:hypothetical protein
MTLPPLVDATPPAPSDATPASAPASVVPAGGRFTATPATHGAMEQRAALGLRARRDLRRAFVLAAILGPCRANSFRRSAFDE